MQGRSSLFMLLFIRHCEESVFPDEAISYAVVEIASLGWVSIYRLQRHSTISLPRNYGSGYLNTCKTDQLPGSQFQFAGVAAGGVGREIFTVIGDADGEYKALKSGLSAFQITFPSGVTQYRFESLGGNPLGPSSTTVPNMVWMIFPPLYVEVQFPSFRPILARKSHHRPVIHSAVAYPSAHLRHSQTESATGSRNCLRR